MGGTFSDAISYGVEKTKDAKAKVLGPSPTKITLFNIPATVLNDHADDEMAFQSMLRQTVVPANILHPDAKAFDRLFKPETKRVSIGVIGQLDTGKSYLLNHICSVFEQGMDPEWPKNILNKSIELPTHFRHAKHTLDNDGHITTTIDMYAWKGGEAVGSTNLCVLDCKGLDASISDIYIILTMIHFCDIIIWNMPGHGYKFSRTNGKAYSHVLTEFYLSAINYISSKGIPVFTVIRDHARGYGDIILYYRMLHVIFTHHFNYIQSV